MSLEADHSLRVTMLGHASLIIETADIVLYCDPVLHDPHHEGLFQIYPPRTVDFKALPRPTHIFISHQHFDHFDLRSLADFSRDTPVITPTDPMIVDALNQLGFHSIEQIADWNRYTIGRTDLLFTPSEFKLPEHGIIVRTPDATLWNQVDTIVPLEAVARVRDEVGSIDLLLAPWQPLLDMFVQYNQDYRFPVAPYTNFLIAAARVGAKTVVPGACGFSFVAPWDWQNHVCFPVTRERCIRDLERLRTDPEQSVIGLDPGDCIAVRKSGVLMERSPAISRTGHWLGDAIKFDPTHSRYIGTQVFTPAPDTDADALVQDAAARFWLALEKDTELAESYRQWEVIYELTLVDGDTRHTYHFDLCGDEHVVDKGPHPFANMHSIVALGALAERALGGRSWDWPAASGAYRHHQSIFQLSPHGIEAPKNGLPDPLWIAFPHAESVSDKLNAEIARYRNRAPILGVAEEERV